MTSGLGMIIRIWFRITCGVFDRRDMMTCPGLVALELRPEGNRRYVLFTYRCRAQGVVLHGSADSDGPTRAAQIQILLYSSVRRGSSS
jgi:hypothetical protein